MTTLKLTIFYLCILFISVTNVFSQSRKNNYSKEFDTLLLNLFPAQSPGGTVLVAKEGRVLYQKAFGKANLELNAEMKPDYVFRIGSITKQFTACAILKLSEEGRLSLQDSITQFIKDYPTHGYTITIEHLLTHTSGIKNITSMPAWNTDFRKKDVTPADLVNFFKNEPMDFIPGQAFRYSNSNYILLGYIVELASGKTYEQYLNDTFFKPLGLQHTFVDKSSHVIDNRVAGYVKTDESFTNADYLSMTQPYGAGSLLSNVQDLYTWYTAVANYKVISQKSLEKAHTPYRLTNGRLTGYGYGWHIGNIQSSTSIRHDGLINGFTTSSLYLPKEKVFVVIFSNCEGTYDLDNTVSKLAAIAIDKPYQWERMPLASVDLASYEGIYKSETDGDRIIAYEDDRLVLYSKGGGKVELVPYTKDRFYLSNQLATLAFTKDITTDSCSFSLQSIGTPVLWKRIRKDVQKYSAIPLSVEALTKYTGAYQFVPEFILTITLEGNKLYGKATGRGQMKQEILPYAPDKFFAKNLDATLTFTLNEQGVITGMTLFQNGEKKAQKIN